MLGPLFIPLTGKYFDAFASGEKRVEYRIYGRRWNEQTCTIGRPVVLSRGYGRSNRLNGWINRFGRRPAESLKLHDQSAILDIFGTLDVEIACIGIAVER